MSRRRLPISQRMPVMLARSDPADDGDQTSEQEHTAEEQQHPTRDKRTERVGAREPAPSRQHRSGDGDDRAEDDHGQQEVVVGEQLTLRMVISSLLIFLGFFISSFQSLTKRPNIISDGK